MGSPKNKLNNNGSKKSSLPEQLIYKKTEETKALRKLLKALEDDGIKTNVKPNSQSK
ncbi:MAG: hypothetical protein HGA37_13875 [Lentimicrobium sp.]|nr:hypothetical protein [Lentimicrobium sp.]